MKIFLVGLPGSGKTTLGKQLAERLQLLFVDLDAEIEKQEAKSVQQIFAEKGELYFREVESISLKSIGSRQDSFVMATGGGTPCFFQNMKLMNDTGKTIFINVPITDISDRLQKTNLAERPLFAQLNPEQLKNKLELLQQQRLSFYKQAQIIFSQPTVSIEQLIEKIKA